MSKGLYQAKKCTLKETTSIWYYLALYVIINLKRKNKKLKTNMKGKKITLKDTTSPVEDLGRPLWHASEVSATETPHDPRRKPICCDPASRRESGTCSNNQTSFIKHFH